MAAPTTSPSPSRSLHPVRREHSIVTLREAVTAEGRVVPEGSKGVIVHVYQQQAAFAVEFQQPFACVATVEPHQIADLIP